MPSESLALKNTVLIIFYNFRKKYIFVQKSIKQPMQYFNVKTGQKWKQSWTSGLRSGRVQCGVTIRKLLV